MTKKDYTHLTLVVDRSGSMSSMKEEADQGIASLLESQFKLPGKLTVSLIEFDDRINDVARLATTPFEYKINPRANTALLDAVGGEIRKTGEDLASLAEDERPSKVVFFVVTDGAENSSHEYTLEVVRALIEKQKNEFQWSFQFIGAGDSAWQGKALGMGHSRYDNSKLGSTAAYASMNASLRDFRADASVSAKLSMPEDIKS